MKGELKIVLSLAALALARVAGASAAPPEPSWSLRVVADHSLPPGRSVPVDVRWAGDHSVFLARLTEGVFEIQLGEPLTTLRQPVPAPEVLKLGRLNAYAYLAVSPRHLLVSSGISNLAWRPIGGRKGGEIPFVAAELASVHDVDLAGDRILALGLREPVPENRNGGIAWLGSLSARFEDARLLLRDENHELDASTWLSSRCAALPLGAVRFLRNGSFLVVPGFQPGAYQFDSRGQLMRRWSNQEIGLTTECSKVPFAALMRPGAFVSWIARHRVVDDVLPLPEGPGLLVRFLGEDGKVHWDLTVLRADGISTIPLPFTGTRPSDRLHGDVRGDEVVFLMASGELWPQEPASSSGRLIVAVREEGR